MPITKQMIEQMVVDILVQQSHGTHENINTTTNLRYDLGMDSLDILSLEAYLERDFNVPISFYDQPEIKTVEHLVDFIANKLENQTRKVITITENADDDTERLAFSDGVITLSKKKAVAVKAKFNPTQDYKVIQALEYLSNKTQVKHL